jgi:hypothetical protein
MEVEYKNKKRNKKQKDMCDCTLNIKIITPRIPFFKNTNYIIYYLLFIC